MSEPLFKKVQYKMRKLIGDIGIGSIGLPGIQWPFVRKNSQICVAFILLLLVAPRAYSQDLRAYSQPSIPDGWTETPFVETAPVPELSTAEKQRGFLLFQRPIVEPVYANTRPLPHERLESLIAFATPGELEPVTLSLYPVRDLKNVSVRCSELTSDTGSIDPSQVDVRLMTYWNVGYPRYASRETYRRVPELLERVDAHSSPKEECQRWWLTIRVPDDAKAGLYRGMVTVKEDVLKQPVRIPLTLRVLGFQLQRDPRKHLSAYYYPRNRSMFEGRDDAFIDRATANEYRSMVDHGLNMLPTFYLQLDREADRIVIQESQEVDRMLKAGLKGPLPILGDNAITRIYLDTTPDGKRESHWAITKLPPPEFYKRITEQFSKLKQECEERGWPELICCPLDEVAASSTEFGVKVYQAVKAAGIRTYATKSPTTSEAADYQSSVDVWCSQPYAKPYEKVIADKQHEYWSYPNHNAGERKMRRAMCKGGRMTYGFGYWRSGYTNLIPWHWAWTMRPDPLDYLRSPKSGSGMRIDERGEVMPAIYWECFREGYDDARYIYTLQQAAWERETSADPKCRQLVSRALAGLQQIWDSIEAQERYLEDHMWPSSGFNARRWQMALMTEQLLKHPPSRQGNAPSVYVERTTAPAIKESSIVQQAEAAGKLDMLDLGEDFSKWKGETPEQTVGVLPPGKDAATQSPGMRFSVKVDHLAGGTSDGKYNVGWPRVRRTFKRGEVDLTEYDFLEILLQVDSDRDEVQDDVTRLGISLGSHDLRRLHEFRHDLGDRQREMIQLNFSLPEMIRASGKDPQLWKSLSHLQLFVSESDYRHGTSLQFDVHRVRLLRFKEPVIAHIDAPSIILLPRKKMAIPFELMGTRGISKDSHRLSVSLIDSAGRKVTQSTANLASDRLVVIDTSSLSAGSYRLKTAIATGENENTFETSTLQAVDGPAFAR